MERVYTVTDYYDGPRAGVADFEGKPHYYESQFSDIDDEYEDTYLLSPISEDTFKLALEAWEIWERWSKKYHKGEVKIDSHPALPSDTVRMNELRELLGTIMVIDQARCIKANARFTVDEHRKKAFQQPFAMLVEWERL